MSALALRRIAYRMAQLAVGIGLGLFFGWLAIRGLDWSEVRQTLADFPLPFVALALAVFLLGIYLRAARWRLLFVRERVSVTRLFLVQNAGIGLNSVSPIRVLSEPTQFGILTLRDRLPGGSVLATMAVERAMDTVVNVVVVGAGLLVFTFLLPFAPYVAVGALASAGGIALLVLAGVGGRQLPFLRRLPMVGTFGQALKTLGSSRRVLLLAMAFSFLYWGLVGISGWIITLGLEMDVAVFFIVVLVQAAILFSTSVPGLPGAFGTFEFATVHLLRLWGIPQETAFIYALILHLLLFLPSVVIALVVLPREGWVSVRILRGVLTRRRTPPQDPGE